MIKRFLNNILTKYGGVLMSHGSNTPILTHTMTNIATILPNNKNLSSHFSIASNNSDKLIIYFNCQFIVNQ